MKNRRFGDDAVRHASVGIATPEQMKARLYAGARGETVADASTPKAWMTLEALMRLLTDENLQLLAIIERDRPRSVSDLAERVGREQSNVSRTISKLERAGLVRLVAEGREKRPELLAKHIRIDVELSSGKWTFDTAA